MSLPNCNVIPIYFNKASVFLAALSLAAAIGIMPAHAQQIIPNNDGTMTIVTQEGNRFNIDGGKLSGDGKNLFHSFQEFGLDANQIANFLSNPSIRNILSRINGGNPSIINGLIQVTGGNSNLFLMNPAGIIFGSNASLNVPADFTATTATGIGLDGGLFNAFGSNDYINLVGNPNAFLFEGSEAGTIINAGDLTVAPEHNLSLIGGIVINTGTIEAPEGKITVTAVPGTNRVQISQEGQIISLEVELPTTEDGQQQPIRVLDLPTLLTGLPENVETGLSANSNGTVQLSNSDTTIPTDGGTAIASGTLDVSGEMGGSVNVLGDQVGVIGANIDAFGTNGGGTVLIGGDYKGQGTVPNALETTFSSDSAINTDALQNGDGGKIIIYAERTANIYGELTARGGSDFGNGGFIETSGKQFLNLTSTPDASAQNGIGGTWLIDPDITILSSGGAIGTNTVGADLISHALNTGISVTLDTSTPRGVGAGNITQNAGAAISKTAGGDATLTLNAENDILLNDSITSSSGRLNLNLNGDSDNLGRGAVDINGAISTNGGDITISGNNNDGTFSNGIGVAISSPINSGGGNILIEGTTRSAQGFPPNSSFDRGIDLAPGATITSGGGNITLNASNIEQDGIVTFNPINSGGGDITFTVTSASNNKISIQNSLNSGTGNITLTADEIALFNTVSGTGNFTLQPFTVDQGIELGGTSDTENLDLTAVELTLIDNFSTVTIGQTNGSGAINLGDPIDLSTKTFDLTLRGGNITFNSGITIRDNGILTLNVGEVTSTTGNIDLSAGGAISDSDPEVDITANVARFDVNGNNIGTSTNSLNTNVSTLSIFGSKNPATSGANNAYITETNDLTLNTVGVIDKLEVTATNGGISTTESINAGGDITLGANQNITTGDIINPGGEITITSNSGNIDSSAGTLDTSSENDGGAITLTAPGNITTGDIDSSSVSGTGGTINLISIKGAIVTGDLNSSGVSGNEITVDASTTITTGAINSSGSVGNGGKVTLDPSGDVQVTSINSQGGSSGSGGSVNITTEEDFRATGTIQNSNISIFTAGGNGGGDITIRYGGNGEIPFEVGDATINGTADVISSGDFAITPDRSFLFTFREGNIQIISVDSPPVEPVISPPEKTILPLRKDPIPPVAIKPFSTLLPETRFTREFETYLGISETPIKTLDESQEILRQIKEASGVKPALIYVIFFPQTVLSAEQLNFPPQINDRLELVLVTSEGQPIRKWVEGVTRKQVGDTADQFRGLVLDKESPLDELYPSAQQLYQWLVAPLEEELEELEIDNLVFMMDTKLRSLPVAALHDGQKFLVEKYSFGLMPSISLTDTRYKDVSNMSVLAVGFTEFPDEVPLPIVKTEVDVISKQLWSGKFFLDEEFTKDKFQEVRTEQAFGIVHLSTHANFQSGDSSNTYIHFQDKKLRLNEVRELGLNDPPTELMVLSACRTVLGDEYAELGFAGFSAKAGSKSTIASLRYVDAVSTFGLMVDFYAQLKQVPIKAEALRQAQLSMIRKEVRQEKDQLVTEVGSFPLPPELSGSDVRYFDHPYYWSGFTIVGNPW